MAVNARDPMVIHYVEDMDRAIKFYRDGLELTLASQSPGWTTFRCGEFTLALHILFPNSEEAPLPHAGLNFEVESRGGKTDRLRGQAGDHSGSRRRRTGPPRSQSSSNKGNLVKSSKHVISERGSKS